MARAGAPDHNKKRNRVARGFSPCLTLKFTGCKKRAGDFDVGRAVKLRGAGRAKKQRHIVWFARTRIIIWVLLQIKKRRRYLIKIFLIAP